jgi:CheY-like chemotaxis protein
VLLNLLSNAFKFTEPGGAVDVRVRVDAGEAVVEVRDTGVGIAPEHCERVFDRFFQADDSATRRREGSGIGLSLVREVVTLHGGSASVASELGRGSTFTVRLPMDPLHAAASPADTAAGQDEGQAFRAPAGSPVEGWVPFQPRLHTPAGEDGGGSPEQSLPGPSSSAQPGGGEDSADAEDRTIVLVVDDNADVRAYVRSILESSYRVLEAVDGEAGLEAARDALPDLVIADVMMPGLDGFGLARALRADPATDCIPVILLTARAAADDEVEGLGTGADDYVSKPFNAGVLEARVANLIAGRRWLRERFRQEGLPVHAAPVAAERPRSALETRLRAIVEARLTEPDFNPEALAAAAGMSYKSLYRRLAAEVDATPSQFIRTVRVERAADLLKDGAGSVTEVAYSVGFNSLSHFHRCFRERFGAAPTAALHIPA